LQIVKSYNDEGDAAAAGCQLMTAACGTYPPQPASRKTCGRHCVFPIFRLLRLLAGGKKSAV